MADQRIPDPTLMARLQLSVKGIDWAASLVRPWQHQEVDDAWSAHRQLKHLIAVETENYHIRVQRILREDRPVLDTWDIDVFNRGYTREGDVEDLAETFMAERAKTVEMFKDLEPLQWARTAVWPDGREVDLAWVAEKVLWHALDHFQQLLDLHQEFEPLPGRRWLAQSSETAS